MNRESAGQPGVPVAALPRSENVKANHMCAGHQHPRGGTPQQGRVPAQRPRAYTPEVCRIFGPLGGRRGI